MATGRGARLRRRMLRLAIVVVAGETILQHALRQADLTKITDEAQAIEALGVQPRLVHGSPLNIKVTYPEDVALAEAILAQRKPVT